MSFDALAPFYAGLEWLAAGSLLQQTRVAFLDELSNRKTILSVGEGHGRFAEACVARFPSAALTCVEQSQGMCTQAQRRLGARADSVTWLTADVREAALDGPYDALVTCFFLDCFSPQSLDEVVDALARVAAPDAVWLIADFSMPAGPAIARARARAAHALMYAFFRSTTSLSARALTPPDAALERNGFRRVGRKHFDWGLLQADCWRRGSQSGQPGGREGGGQHVSAQTPHQR